VTPYLAPELLSVFLRCHDSAGRKSVATSIDGKLKQKEAGQLFEFINVLIQPLNRYLITALHRKVPLSAARLARFALDKRREEKQIELEAAAKKAAKKAVVAMIRQAAKRPS